MIVLFDNGTCEPYCSPCISITTIELGNFQWTYIPSFILFEMISPIYFAPESTKSKLEDELHYTKTHNDDAVRLQQDIEEMKTDLKQVTQKLHETETNLTKEKAKTKSLSMHSEVSEDTVLLIQCSPKVC